MHGLIQTNRFSRSITTSVSGSKLETHISFRVKSPSISIVPSLLKVYVSSTRGLLLKRLSGGRIRLYTSDNSLYFLTNSSRSSFVFLLQDFFSGLFSKYSTALLPPLVVHPLLQLFQGIFFCRVLLNKSVFFHDFFRFISVDAITFLHLLFCHFFLPVLSLLIFSSFLQQFRQLTALRRRTEVRAGEC